MPWDIVSAGNGKYNVRSQKSGKVVGRKLSEQRAKAMLRALYANVPDATTNATPKGYPKGVDMKVAKKVDLIVLPVAGTNCGNCKFVTKDKEGLYCDNPKVKQPVTNHLCCALWDNSKVKRPWGKEAVTVNEKEKQSNSRRIKTRKRFVQELLAAGHPKEDCSALMNMSLDALAGLVQNYWTASARAAAIAKRRMLKQNEPESQEEQDNKGFQLRSAVPKKKMQAAGKTKDSKRHWKAILAR